MTSMKEESWQLRTIEIVTLEPKCSMERLNEIPEHGAVRRFLCWLFKCVQESLPPVSLKAQTNRVLRTGCYRLLFLRVLVIFLFSCSSDFSVCLKSHTGLPLLSVVVDRRLPDPQSIIWVTPSLQTHREGRSV